MFHFYSHADLEPIPRTLLVLFDSFRLLKLKPVFEGLENNNCISHHQLIINVNYEVFQMGDFEQLKTFMAFS